MLRRPIQAWLPLIGQPQSFSSLRIAFAQHSVEWCIWFLPGLAEFRRYARDGWWELAVPSTQFDRIDVFHVTAAGVVSGDPGRRAERFGPQGSVDGLLEEWLAIRPRTPPVGEAGEMVVSRPFFDDGSTEPVFRDERVRILAEAHEARVARWGQRIVSLLGVAADPDEVVEEQEHMRAIALKGGHDAPTALVGASAASFPYVHDAHVVGAELRVATALVEGALMEGPLAEGGEHRLRSVLEGSTSLPSTQETRAHAQARLRAETDTAEALDDDVIRAMLAQSVWVRRTLGVIGLTWALLLDRLEDLRGFASCERCGAPIALPQRFCPAGTCFDERQAERQRRSRHERAAFRKGGRKIPKGRVP